jgi:hypothetical protein
MAGLKKRVRTDGGYAGRFFSQSLSGPAFGAIKNLIRTPAVKTCLLDQDLYSESDKETVQLAN